MCIRDRSGTDKFAEWLNMILQCLAFILKNILRIYHIGKQDRQDDRNNIGDIQLHLQLSENEKADQIYHSGTSAKENIADNGTFIHFSDPLLHKIYPLSPVYFHS